VFGFLFSLYGRISRETYWLSWILPYLGVSIVAALLDAAMFPVNPETGEPTAVFQAIIGLILLWPSLAVTTKRLHDRGMTGWWQIAPALAVIPLAVASYWYYTNKMNPGAQATNLAVVDPTVGAVLTIGIGSVVAWLFFYPLISALFLRGQTGPNKYGDDPLGHPADTFT
jgi:uncharacterized membrane protein YhaH (DUF805 family)